MNVLMLSTYPFEEPRHGGQLRAYHIAETFRGCGAKVQAAGVLGNNMYSRTEGYEPFPGQASLNSTIDNPTLLEDWGIGRLYGGDGKYFRSLASRVTIQPDLIYVEQPWLWQFATRFAETLKRRPKLVYSSQNIEYQLKKAILQRYLTPNEVERKVALVRQCELAAIAQADGVVCVSETDQAWILAQRSIPTIIAPNGVAAWDRSGADVVAANAMSGGLRYALYCASAHPPNVTGFFEMFGGGFGSLSPDQRLVVAGGAGENILRSEEILQSAKLADRYISAGIVSTTILHGLLEEAHCVVLPLTEGGGTNLKTAEALWSGHHIVATSTAMRGFERFSSSPGVNVADTPAAFKRALRRAMQAPPLKLDAAERKARNTLLWDECLRGLPKFSDALLQREQTSE